MLIGTQIHLPTLDEPYILNGYNRQLTHSDIIGSLSVKTIFRGSATYGVEGSNIRLDDNRYLILNHAQPYDMLIEADETVESFCVFFPQSWLSDVFQNMTSTDNDLLENPYDTTQPFLFFEIPHQHDQLVSPIMLTLREKYQTTGINIQKLTPLFYSLIHRLIVSQSNAYEAAKTFSAVKASTRLELYRRLNLAKEYMMANLHHQSSLSEFAQVAYMSPYHFLRRFTEAFHVTPHHFIIQQRLKHAEHLLVTTQLSVTDICMSIGFSSLGSFSSLFSKVYGVSPRRFRQTNNQYTK